MTAWRFVWRVLTTVTLALLLTACSLNESAPQTIYITATSPSSPAMVTATQNTSPVELSPVPGMLSMPPTPDPPRFDVNTTYTATHIVQPGDTLYGIALLYGTSLTAILTANAFENPDTLFVGQEVRLPERPTQQTPDMKIVPDGRFVRGPGSRNFDIAAFIQRQPGHIRTATDTVPTSTANNMRIQEMLSAAQVIARVSLEYSVDPRLLLALLEYRAGWLSSPVLETGLDTHPMIAPEDSGAVDRTGLYAQLAWTADQLNLGYYGWKYRSWTTLELSGGARLLYAPGLNAATVGLHYFLSLFTPATVWQRDVSLNGFYATYYAYFGDPFTGVTDPIVPQNIQQPPMTLPFASGETWYYTGGPHGGWGSGSAWAAVDFAPPDVPPEGVFCYTSESWVRAVASGIIAWSSHGIVILDLDGDGDETTGWTVFYLHIAAKDRIEAGTWVDAGERIGHASCEGGFSTATHLHLARRYNGEWIPADCPACSGFDMRPVFRMGDWSVVGISNQEYQGYMVAGEESRIAEQGRLDPNNHISW